MDVNVNLSAREDQITELLSWGASSKQVADKLFISKDTVVNHRRNIFQKLGIHSIGQLCAWFFCKRFKIPTSLNPIPMIAILFLGLCTTDLCYVSHNKNVDVKIAKVKKSKSENDCDI